VEGSNGAVSNRFPYRLSRYTSEASFSRAFKLHIVRQVACDGYRPQQIRP
jgi:hypothetical protein